MAKTQLSKEPPHEEALLPASQLTPWVVPWFTSRHLDNVKRPYDLSSPNEGSALSGESPLPRFMP